MTTAVPVQVYIQSPFTTTMLYETQVELTAQPLVINLSHEVKELGLHTIFALCDKVKMKPLSFTCVNPLSVRTKVTPVELGKISLEVQMQNMTADKLECELVFLSKDPVELSSGSERIALESNQIVQMVYLLHTKQKVLGKIDIKWSSKSETGRLQTSQLTRKVSEKDWEVAIKKDERIYKTMEPFKLILQVANNTSDSIEMDLKNIKSDCVFVREPLPIKLHITNDVVHNIPIEVMAIKQGIHSVEFATIAYNGELNDAAVEAKLFVQ